MNAAADGQGQVFQAGRDIVISGQPHANARKLTVLNVAAAAQVLTEMAASADTRDEAVVIVADMDPEVARLRLQAMPPESAGQILARMDHQLAYERLVRIPDTKAAAVLGHMPAEPAAELLVKHSRETMLRLLSGMEPEQAAGILLSIPAKQAATLASDLSPRLTAANNTALFDAIPVRRLAKLLAELSFDQVVRLMEVMSPEIVLRLLSGISPSDAASLLTAMSVGHAARVLVIPSVVAVSEWLAEMPADALVESASDLLSEFSNFDLAMLLMHMRARQACHIVAGLPAERAANALIVLQSGRIAVLLALVAEDHAKSILQRLPADDRQQVETYLA